MGDGIGGLGPGGGDSIESLGGHYKYSGEADAPRGAVNNSAGKLKWQFKERTEDGKHLFKVTTLSGREVLDLTFDPDVSISSALQTIEALGSQYASCVDEDAILQQRDNFLEGGNTVKLKIDDGKRPKNPLQSPGLNLPSWVPGKSAINYASRLFGSFNPSENKGIVRVFVCETHNGQLTDKAHLAVECNFDTGKITKYEKENHLVGHTFFDIKKVSTTATEMMGTIASTHDAASRILEHIQQNIEYVFDPTQAAVIDSGDPSLDIDRADATQLDIRKREKEERAKKLGKELNIEGVEAPRTLTIEADDEELTPDIRTRLSLVDPFEIPEELKLSFNPELDIGSFDSASRGSLVDKFLEAFEDSSDKEALKESLLDPTLTLAGAQALINSVKESLTLISDVRPTGVSGSGEEGHRLSGGGGDGLRSTPEHDVDIQIGVIKQDELTEFANSLKGDYTPAVRQDSLNNLFRAYQDTPELQSLKEQLSAEGITEEKAIELIAGAIDSLSPLPEGEEIDLRVEFSSVDWENTESREEVFDDLFEGIEIPEDKLEELAALKEECLGLDTMEKVLAKKDEFLSSMDDSYEVSFAERRRNSIGDIIADNEGLEDKLKEAFKKATLEERKDAIKNALSDICCPLTIDSLLAQLSEDSSLEDLIDSDGRRLSTPEEMELSFEERVETDSHFVTALKTALATSTQDLTSRKNSLRNLLKEELHYPDATIERVVNDITLDSDYEQLIELIKKEERAPDMSAQICDAAEEEIEAIKAALNSEEAHISFKERETLSTAEASISALLGKAEIPKPEALYTLLKHNWGDTSKREAILRDILRPYNNLDKVLEAVMKKSTPEEAIKLLELRREYANDQIEEAIRAQVSSPQNPTTKRGRIIAALKKEYDKTLEEYRLAAHPNWHELAAQRTRYGTYPDPNAAVLDHIGRREGEMEKIYLKLCALTNSLNKQIAKDDDGHAVENAPKLKYPPKHNSFATVDELDQGNPEFSDIEISFAKARELRTSIGALQQELYEVTSQGAEATTTHDTRVQELRANISEKTRSLRKLLDAPEEEIRERTSGLSREILLPEKLEERYQALEKLAKEDSLTSSHKRTATKGPFGRYSSSKLKNLRKLEAEYTEKTSLAQNFEENLKDIKGKDFITEEEAGIFVEEMKSFYLGIFGTEKGPSAATKEKLKRLVGKGDDGGDDHSLTAAKFIDAHKTKLLEILQDPDQRNDLLDQITIDIDGDVKAVILPELSTKIDQKKRGLSSYVKNMRRFPFEKGALDKKDVKRAQHWIAGCQAQQFFLDAFLDRNTDFMRDTASRLSTVNLCDKEAGLSPYGMMQVDLGAAENPSPLSELIPEDRIANAQDAAVNLSSLNANLLPQCFESIETDDETLLSYLEKFTEEGELIDPKNQPTEEEKSAAQVYILELHGNPPADEVKLVADMPVIEQLYHELQEIAAKYKSKDDRPEAISRFRELQMLVKQHMSKVTKDSPQGKILTKLNERLQAFTPFEEAFDSENFLERSEGPHASFSEIISEGERDTKTYNTLICVNDISKRLQEIRDIKERVPKPAGDDYSGRALYNEQIEGFNRTIETTKSEYDSELSRLVEPYQADIASIDQAVEKAYQIIRESQNQEEKIPREFMMDGNFNPLEVHRHKLIEIQKAIIRPLKEKAGKIKSSYADLPEWFKSLATHIEQLQKDIENIEGKIGDIQEASLKKHDKAPSTLYEALNKGEGFVDSLKKALFTRGRKKTRSKFKTAVQGRSNKKSRVKQRAPGKFTFIDALDGISSFHTLSMISSLS